MVADLKSGRDRPKVEFPGVAVSHNVSRSRGAKLTVAVQGSAGGPNPAPIGLVHLRPEPGSRIVKSVKAGW
jgi:hypothetical protein